MVLVSTGELTRRVAFLASTRAVANFFGEQQNMSNQALYILKSEQASTWKNVASASTNVIFASNSST